MLKTDWTLRWWDVLALVLALAAAGFVVQYSMARGSAGIATRGNYDVEVRSAKLYPEIIAQLSAGDSLVSRQGKKAGEILSVQVLPAAAVPGQPEAHGQEIKLHLRVTGDLELMRDTPGFSREPGKLKAGNWCIVSTRKVEISGMITRVEAYEEQGMASLGWVRP